MFSDNYNVVVEYIRLCNGIIYRESLFILTKDKKTTRKNFKAINLNSF